MCLDLRGVGAQDALDHVDAAQMMFERRSGWTCSNHPQDRHCFGLSAVSNGGEATTTPKQCGSLRRFDRFAPCRLNNRRWLRFRCPLVAFDVMAGLAAV